MNSITMINLPATGTLPELWDTLGFPELGGNFAVGDRDIRGIYRRLAAGVSSVLARGFSLEQFSASPADEFEFHSVEWNSDGGFWSSRAWRVTTQLSLSSQGVRLIDTVIAVQSPSSGEWTAFAGRALNHVLAPRFSEVLAVIGARDASATDELTAKERADWHDIHGGPIKAFLSEEGRVVLFDDQYGRGALRGNAPSIVNELRSRGLEVIVG